MHVFENDCTCFFDPILNRGGLCQASFAPRAAPGPSLFFLLSWKGWVAAPPLLPLASPGQYVHLFPPTIMDPYCDLYVLDHRFPVDRNLS